MSTSHTNKEKPMLTAVAQALPMTLGDIAREVNETKHRVQYALEQYHIDPIGRAGIIRLWDREQLPQIKSALARISSRRTH